VVDLEIFKYFDVSPHAHLRGFLDQRVKNGVLRKMIDKWLKAGVLEEGVLRRAADGKPQGGVISPLHSNIFLHHVLDDWFETVARPRLAGRSLLVRYADDAVMAFEDRESGLKMLDALGKRLGRYGLTLHPTKTRFVDFQATPARGGSDGAGPTTFDFLGFTHVWEKSLKGAEDHVGDLEKFGGVLAIALSDRRVLEIITQVGVFSFIAPEAIGQEM